MTDEKILLTREGLDKIKLEYDELVSIRRAEVADKIREARSYGDLSENAEYDAAKEEQAELEERIHKLETTIRNAVIVSEEEMSKGTVNIRSCKTAKASVSSLAKLFLSKGKCSKTEVNCCSRSSSTCSISPLLQANSLSTTLPTAAAAAWLITSG